MDSVDAPIRVELVRSPGPGQVERLTLNIHQGATIADALQRCGWQLPEDQRVGVWGRQRPLTDTLRDLDRVELYRPLKVDPKEARRQRYRSHRAASKP